MRRADGAVFRGPVHPSSIRTMSRTLSSQWTGFLKYVVPVVVAGFAVRIAQLWRHTPATLVDATTGQSQPNPVWLLFPVLNLLMIPAAWRTMRYVSVRVESDGALVVSGYFGREWRVPASLITSVKQNRWLQMRPITVQLRSDVGFGTKFTFAPPRRMFAQWRFFTDDPEADVLRDLAANSASGWRSRLVAPDGGNSAGGAMPGTL
jgi:hypothetical protein